MPVSYLGLGYGAAMAWGADANRGLDIAAAHDAHAYRDGARVLGKLACDLGDVHQLTGLRVPNGTSLFRILQTRTPSLRSWLESVGARPERMREAELGIDEISDGMRRAEPTCSDAGLVRREFAWSARMLRHACEQAIWARGDEPRLRRSLLAEADQLIEEFTELWRERSRPGGFEASVSRMVAMRQDYE